VIFNQWVARSVVYLAKSANGDRLPDRLLLATIARIAVELLIPMKLCSRSSRRCRIARLLLGYFDGGMDRARRQTRHDRTKMKTRYGEPVSLARRCRRAAVPAALALALAGCAAGPSLVGLKAPATPEYVIGPGDTLNIFVYRAPELSADVPVRPDGRISTPLVPDVLALNKTPSQLAATIESRLKKYVKEPVVTVMVTGFAGPADLQIKVIGEVGQPLVLPYRAELSLLDVMLAAKGLTRFADGNRAVIVRQEPGGSRRFIVRLDDLLTDGDISQNVAMKPGDILFVPQAWF
jgi:polysaccharide export outer membrane protein